MNDHDARVEALGDEDYRWYSARQTLAFAQIHLLDDLRRGLAAGQETVSTAAVIRALEKAQRRARHTLNAPFPHSRKTGEPCLPQVPETERSPEETALILRIVAAKCEELARIAPDGSHGRRALSDLSLLAEGWITPEVLGCCLPDAD